MNDFLLFEYILQYFYDMNYLKKFENDDTLFIFDSQKKSSKKHRKKSKHLNESIWRDDESISHENESFSSEQKSNCFTKIESRDNVTIHVQMYAIANYYDIFELQKMTRRKFKIAFVKIRDFQDIVKFFKFVCNSQFRNDAIFRDIMMNKIAKHNNLLNYAKIKEILHENEKLNLTITKRMRWNKFEKF